MQRVFCQWPVKVARPTYTTMRDGLDTFGPKLCYSVIAAYDTVIIPIFPYLAAFFHFYISPS